MRLSRSIAPLLNAAVGALALMVPVPTTGASVAELAPLPPAVMLASIERVDKDDAALIAVRAEARTAMLRLQAAGSP